MRIFSREYIAAAALAITSPLSIANDLSVSNTSEIRLAQNQSSVPINPNKELVPTPTPAPSLAASSGQSGDQEELTKRLFTAGMVQGFNDRPDVFQGFVHLIHSGSRQTFVDEKNALTDRRQEEEDAHDHVNITLKNGLPLNGETGQNLEFSYSLASSQEELYELEQSRSRDRNNMLRDMSTDQGNREVQDVARYVADIAYKEKSGAQLTENERLVKQYYDLVVVRGESKYIPKSAGTVDALLNGSPDAQNMLAKAKLDIPELQSVLSGQKTLEELDRPTRDKVQSFIINNFQQILQLHVSGAKNPQAPAPTAADIGRSLTDYTNIRDRLDSPELQKIKGWEERAEKALTDPKTNPQDAEAWKKVRKSLQEAEDTEQKRLHLERYEGQVGETRSKLGAVTAVGNLFFKDSPEFQRFSQFSTATLSIYEGLGRMSINGFTDPQGIASVASGIGVLTSLMGPKGKTADEVIIDMLKEIIQTQREILGELRELNAKADIIDKKLDYITNKLSDLDNTLRYNFTEFRETLAWYAHEDELRNRQNTLAILNQANFSGIRTHIEELDGSPGATPEVRKYRGCIANPSACSPEASAHFELLNQDRIALRRTALEQLVATPYYDDKDSIYDRDKNGDQRYSEENLRNKIAGTIEDRAGQIPSAASFLGNHLNVGMTSNYVPPQDILQQKISPYYLTEKVVPLYADLVTHFPATFAMDDIRRDLPQLEAEVAKSKAASEEMRVHADHARMVFAFNAYVLAAQTEAKIDKLAAEYKVPDNGIDVPGHVSESETVGDGLEKAATFFPSMPPFPMDQRSYVQGGLGYIYLAPSTKDNGTIEYVPGDVHDLDEKVIEAGVMFGGFNHEEIRKYLSALNDDLFARLGTAVGAFYLDSVDVSHTDLVLRTNGDFLRFNWVRSERLVPTAEGGHAFLSQVGLAEKAAYPVRQVTDEWIWAPIKENPYKRYVTKQLGTKDNTQEFVSKERKPWEELLALYIEGQQAMLAQAFAKEVNSVATPGTQQSKDYILQRKLVVQSRLVLEDFFQGGYGECLNSEPALQPLRVILKRAADIDQNFHDMQTVSDSNTLIKLQEDAMQEILEIERTGIPEVDPSKYVSGCRMGWGDVKGAEQALLRVENYVHASQEQPSTPAPKARSAAPQAPAR